MTKPQSASTATTTSAGSGAAPDPLGALLAARRAPGWRTAAGAIVLLLAAGIGWSAVAQLDEVSVAVGEVVPQSKVKVIQHLEGGIISEFFVQEGDVVRAGTPLLLLDLAATAINKQEIEVRLDGFRLARARHTAEAAGTDLDLPEDVAARRPDLAAGERAAFLARRNEFEKQVSVLREQVEQRRQEIRELEARQGALASSLRLAQEKLALSTRLLKDNLTPKLEHLAQQAEVQSLEGDLAVIAQSIPRARSALSEAEKRVEEETLRLRREAQEGIAEAELNIARTQELLNDATDQELRTEVKSPIDGVVKNMRYSTIGGVVKGGEPIMDIVPTGDTLIIEARLNPVDRGYVRVGQPATVKVTTYDYARYGGLEGTVTHVAPDSTTPEQEPPYFRVLVETSRDYLGANAGEFAITPGMQATVDIHTGTRSVLEYLIKPVLKLKHEAFRER